MRGGNAWRWIWVVVAIGLGQAFDPGRDLGAQEKGKGSLLLEAVLEPDHVDLTWGPVEEGEKGRFSVQRSTDGENFGQIAESGGSSYQDTKVKGGGVFFYQVSDSTRISNIVKVATRAAAPPPADKEPPIAPTNLHGTAVSSRQIDLAWEPSANAVRYFVRRRDKRGETTQSWNTTKTFLQDKKVSQGATYRYQVRVFTSSKKPSEWSGAVEVTAPAADTTPPKAPEDLAASPVSHLQIDLTWNPSEEKARYQVERSTDGKSFLPLGRITQSTIFIDTDLFQERRYWYRVRAIDPAENKSDWSATTEIVAPDPPDTEPPTPPNGLQLAVKSDSRIDLTWSESTDNVGVVGYVLERRSDKGDFQRVAQASSTNYKDTGLAPDTAYTYRVRALDPQDNLSEPGEEVEATTQSSKDLEAPSAPGDLKAKALSSDEIELSWEASKDNVGVVGYRIRRSDSKSWKVTATEALDSGLQADAEYDYEVVAFDEAGNESSLAHVSAKTSMAKDHEPPGAPTNLTARVRSSIQAHLSWMESIDKGSGIAGYKVERSPDGGVTFGEIASAKETEFTDSGLSAGAMFLYRVRALDGAGNISDAGNWVAVLTPPSPDTIAPTVPGALAAAAVSESQIDLAWMGSSDGGGAGLAGYKIERSMDAVNFVQIAVTPLLRISDRGLVPGAFYWYRVQAFDNAGNDSERGNVAVAATSGVASLPEREDGVDKEDDERTLSVCGLIGLDLIFPLGLLWLARRRRLLGVRK